MCAAIHRFGFECGTLNRAVVSVLGAGKKETASKEKEEAPPPPATVTTEVKERCSWLLPLITAFCALIVEH